MAISPADFERNLHLFSCPRQNQLADSDIGLVDYLPQKSEEGKASIHRTAEEGTNHLLGNRPLVRGIEGVPSYYLEQAPGVLQFLIDCSGQTGCIGREYLFPILHRPVRHSCNIISLIPSTADRSDHGMCRYLYSDLMPCHTPAGRPASPPSPRAPCQG